MAIHKASLEMFDEVGMDALREKSDKLTAYLEFLLLNVKGKDGNKVFELITPTDPKHRGAQLSILCLERGKELFDFITKKGVIADWRNPNVIRVALVPMYNSFEDVYNFSSIMAEFNR